MPYLLLGTSHIAQQSIEEIKHAVQTFQPDIIAVELDKERAQSLLTNAETNIPLAAIRSIGVRGYLFAKIAHTVQQKLGKSIGIAPGSEMKSALLLAKEHKLQAALIDQPIRITLKNFSKTLTWREKGRFLLDIIRGLTSPQKELEKSGLKDLDLRKVPQQEFIEKMIDHLKERYPSIYKVLIEDRNHYMVKTMLKILRNNPEKKMLVIVGAGHLKGMKELLLKIDIIT